MPVSDKGSLKTARPMCKDRARRQNNIRLHRAPVIKPSAPFEQPEKL
ncbi:hypothetical protein [Kingella oralis]|nr:hypothetical protein [Kingella oralis]